jgi:hypothetical protein
MKPFKMCITITLLLTLLTLLTTAGAAQTHQPPASDAPTLALELKRLRLELVQQKLEFQEWKIIQLNRELRQASGEQQRLEEEERCIQQELATLNQHLANNPPPGNGQVSEEETLKAQLNETRLPKLRARQQPVLQLVAELTGQLEREEVARRQFAEQAERLKADLRTNTQ